MGAYIYYKLENPEDTDRANEWLDKQEEQQELTKLGYSLWFWSEEDRKAELEKLRTKGYGCPDICKIGGGFFKASGIDYDIHNKVLSLVAKLFKKLHEHFAVKVYSGSCALRRDYFSVEELRMITNDGKALSGKYKDKVLKEMEAEAIA